MVKNLINGDGIRIYKVNSFTFNVHVSILGCDYLAFSIAALKEDMFPTTIVTHLFFSILA